MNDREENKQTYLNLMGNYTRAKYTFMDEVYHSQTFKDDRAMFDHYIHFWNGQYSRLKYYVDTDEIPSREQVSRVWDTYNHVMAAIQMMRFILKHAYPVGDQDSVDTGNVRSRVDNINVY